MTRNQILAKIKALRAQIVDLEDSLQWIPPLDGPHAWKYVPDPAERRRVPQWDHPLHFLPVSTQTERIKHRRITLIEPKGQAEAKRRASKKYKPPSVVWPAWIRAML